MSLRSEWANTINTIGDHACLLGSECDRFGITWGCRPDCPVFERGECEIQEENEKYFQENNKEASND